jgi:hypothetical protein
VAAPAPWAADALRVRQATWKRGWSYDMGGWDTQAPASTLLRYRLGWGGPAPTVHALACRTCVADDAVQLRIGPGPVGALAAARPWGIEVTAVADADPARGVVRSESTALLRLRTGSDGRVHAMLQLLELNALARAADPATAPRAAYGAGASIAWAATDTLAVGAEATALAPVPAADIPASFLLGATYMRRGWGRVTSSVGVAHHGKAGRGQDGGGRRG